MSNKIIITLEGGLVQNVMATDPDIEVMVVDFDSEGAEDYEILQDEDIQEFAGEDKFIDILPDCGVREGSFDELIAKEE